MSKKKILITVGPTIEPIDPVRFISNASSGKMGQALAVASVKAGFDVTAITSIADMKLPAGAKRIIATSAEQMFKAVKELFGTCDCLIMAAAVSDYTPQEVSKAKLKKASHDLTITLKPTTDILKWAGKNKKPSQFLVGFALEDMDLKASAEKKMADKNLDMIIANSPSAIGGDSSQLFVKTTFGDWQIFPMATKTVSARRIVSIIKDQLD
ncbi:MAG: hypothetical protein K8R02_02560 [Anaerohalosphaeraceae bacterium]|nr:hypothetical protein [Anaerohalosphaeraceae bacterium]